MIYVVYHLIYVVYHFGGRALRARIVVYNVYQGVDTRHKQRYLHEFVDSNCLGLDLKNYKWALTVFLNFQLMLNCDELNKIKLLLKSNYVRQR